MCLYVVFLFCFFRGTRACLEEMAKFEDVCPTAQSFIGLFASQGLDITPNKDRGVCKASVVSLALYLSISCQDLSTDIIFSLCLNDGSTSEKLI